jgi:hypothetical protein
LWIILVETSTNMLLRSTGLRESTLLHGHTNTTLQSGLHRKLSCYQSTHLTKPDVKHSYGNRAGRLTASCSSPSRARRLAGAGDVVHLRAKVSTGSLTTCVRPIVEVCHRRAATHASLVGRLGEVVCNYAVAHRRRPFDTPGSAQDTAQTTCLFFPDQLSLRSVFMYRVKEWNAANTIVWQCRCTEAPQKLTHELRSPYHLEARLTVCSVHHALSFMQSCNLVVASGRCQTNIGGIRGCAVLSTSNNKLSCIDLQASLPDVPSLLDADLVIVTRSSKRTQGL